MSDVHSDDRTIREAPIKWIHGSMDILDPKQDLDPSNSRPQAYVTTQYNSIIDSNLWIPVCGKIILQLGKQSNTSCYSYTRALKMSFVSFNAENLTDFQSPSGNKKV